MKATDITRSYIRQHPSIRACLREGLVNYSALARQICEEHSIKSTAAVLVACRRERERLLRSDQAAGEIAKLMRNAKVNIRTKIAVATIEKQRTLEKLDELHRHVRKARGDFILIEGQEVITIITGREFVPHIRKLLRSKVLRLSEDLVQVSMVMDPSIEHTPGVSAYIYGVLYENGINIREETSCWTDVIFVIEEKDLPKAVRVLSL